MADGVGVRKETGGFLVIGMITVLGTEVGRAELVCTAVGLMKGFDGDSVEHEGDDDDGDPDEGLLAVHPGFHRWATSFWSRPPGVSDSQ
jgi:hypothetical protein